MLQLTSPNTDRQDSTELFPEGDYTHSPSRNCRNRATGEIKITQVEGCERPREVAQLDPE